MLVPLFIIGVPRSGTTLLRIMLDSHPNLAVGPECPWMTGSYGNITSFKDLYFSLVEDKRGPIHNFEGLSDECIALALGEAFAEILTSYAKARGKKRWLEKTPNNIIEIPFLL
ncbi:MAG: sulfotransferase, partial [Cyanobacteria bacterium P01_G01_bin.49]